MSEHKHIWDKSARSYIPCVVDGCTAIIDYDKFDDMATKLTHYEAVVEAAKGYVKLVEDSTSGNDIFEGLKLLQEKVTALEAQDD